MHSIRSPNGQSDASIVVAMQAEVGAAPAAVTVVKTAQQLKDAVVRGDAYVEIQDHLDLSTVDPVDFRILGIPPKTVKSINVCTHSASVAPPICWIPLCRFPPETQMFSLGSSGTTYTCFSPVAQK